MKKLLGIVFLGLLLSANSYAGHSKTLEMVLPNPKCDGLELRLWHDAGGKYIIYVKNPTKVSVKIHSIKFLTKDDDIITKSGVLKYFAPFHLGKIVIIKSNIMHELVKKMSIGCDV